MSILARVTSELAGDIPIAALEGEIDASNVAEIGGHLRAAVSNRSAVLVVDLAGLRTSTARG